MNRIILSVIALLTMVMPAGASDTIPSGFRHRLQWRVGADLRPSWVPGTNGFLKGNNPETKAIRSALSGGIRADFSFGSSTREGILYPGLYQGLGIGCNTFYSNSLLGTPVSAYVYQGSPILRFSDKLCLGYEWQFGAAFGWKHYNRETSGDNAVVSTSVTAHMGIGVKLHYSLSDSWTMSFGLMANHYSNGNTSWPNAGVNTIGADIGISYTLTRKPKDATIADKDRDLIEEAADKGRWHYDVMAYGAWRKRVVSVAGRLDPQLCPGKFGIAGLQFSPLRSLNRWVAVGPSLDMQWDEGAGLSPYWVVGTSGDMIRFRRPPFGKQVSVGLSAHAELTMPVFAVNVGIGYDFVSPEGNRSLYQSLTLKTFITRTLYLNTGYRLGCFKEPQNLMLGIGLRL